MALGESKKLLIDQMCQDQTLKVLKSPVHKTTETENQCMGLEEEKPFILNSNISFLDSTLFRNRSCMAAVSTY